MKNTSKKLSTASVIALAVLGANSAHAAGTTAGSTITNTVTVNYQVGGVSQTAVSASKSFTVDRKVNVTVAELGSSTTTVSPGQTAAVTTFRVTNLSNAVLDFALSAAQQTGGAAPHGGTDNFDATNVRIYVDTNSNNSYDSGTDTLVTYLDELGADGIKTVFVVADIPLGGATDDVAAVTLTATGREGGGASSQGAALTETTGADTASMDTVFADGAGSTDSSRDAAYSAKDDFTVLAASLSVVKSSRLISDPVNGSTDPKAIPGAVIEYCIAVANASGSATATSVALSDPLPSTVTYDSGFGILINGTVDGSGDCQADGSAGGSYGSGTVSGTLSDITAGDTKTLLFRASIN